MAEYDNTNRGVFFKNLEKEKESQPDYRGNINVDGKEYWISGWIKEPKNGGEKFMSISIQPKEAWNRNDPTPINAGRGKASTKDNDVDDDIPF